MARPVQSSSLPSNNIVLKVTVPKWTGRKRKRGSEEPFTADPAAENERRTAKDRLRSLRDNVGKYHVEAVGMVDRAHVFRSKYSMTGSGSNTSLTFPRYARLRVLDNWERFHTEIQGAYPPFRL